MLNCEMGNKITNLNLYGASFFNKLFKVAGVLQFGELSSMSWWNFVG